MRRSGHTIQRIFQTAIRCLSVLVVLFIVCLNAGAQRLPFHNYGVHDGMAHMRVEVVYQDRKGYLWFGTWEGLSRFDGYRFTNYGIRDGLANPIISGITEDRNGNLWVATHAGGVARLIDDPSSRPETALDTSARKKFISYSVSDQPGADALIFDSDNNLLCYTENGIYRARVSGDANERLQFELVVPRDSDALFGGPGSAMVDEQGRLWLGLFDKLVEIDHGQTTQYSLPDNPQHFPVVGIQPDFHGGLYVASDAAVFHFLPPSNADRQAKWEKIPLSLSPWPVRNNTLMTDRWGTLWLGTSYGLIKYLDGQQTTITTAEGLSDNDIVSIERDREGDLWVGTGIGGVCRLSSDRLVSITAIGGRLTRNIVMIVEDREGHIYATTSEGIFELIADRAVIVRGSQSDPFRSAGTRVLQDGRGDWWLGSDQGLFRFRGPLLNIRQGQKFGLSEGLPELPILNGPGIYKDPSGKVWVGLDDHNLYWCDPGVKQTPEFQKVDLQNFWQEFALHMANDRTGALWLGGFNHMARLVAGRATMVEATQGLPEPRPRAFFQDSRGWFWIGLRFMGVSVIKDPTASPLEFINYSTADGLSSDAVWSITEDNNGRMYFGTGKGLDQLDVTTGVMRHFTTDDGLAGDIVNHCLKDSKGNIWIATTGGVSRFDPHEEILRSQPPPVYLSRILVAGEDRPVAETGAVSVPAFTLSSAQNNLLIEYVGLSFKVDRQLRYQYKLEGAGGDWSAVTEQRSINYARLAPGSYKFLVRAVNQAGIASGTPATLEFRILPPVWQSAWFITLVTLVVGLMLYAVYRYRVARLIELERVRTRIATELHDDIGSNLSRIALLSEVVRQQVDHVPQITDRLALIASVSRESVDSMSDIVWAINPDKDHLHDLTQRMRRVAGDMLSARNIDCRFNADDNGQDIKLDVDTRREIFLIFKESLNNVARHSRASSSKIDFKIEHGALTLRISDNGRGFDPDRAEPGNGLESMQQRAAKLRGSLRIISAPQKGTTVTLKVSLERRNRFRP